jgi:hypothetical protein
MYLSKAQPLHMAKEFLLDPSSHDFSSSQPSREPIKHVLYGSKQAIAYTIHALHNKGYAEAGAWSRPQPTQTPGEFMSILLRYLLLS